MHQHPGIVNQIQCEIKWHTGNACKARILYLYLSFVAFGVDVFFLWAVFRGDRYRNLWLFRILVGFTYIGLIGHKAIATLYSNYSISNVHRQMTAFLISTSIT